MWKWDWNTSERGSEANRVGWVIKINPRIIKDSITRAKDVRSIEREWVERTRSTEQTLTNLNLALKIWSIAFGVTKVWDRLGETQRLKGSIRNQIR